MKKKISLLICMLTAVLAFTTGCGKDKEVMQYDEAAAIKVVDHIFTEFPNYDAKTAEQLGQLREFTFELRLIELGLQIMPEEYLSAVDAWRAGIDECGAYVSHGDYVFEPGKDELKVQVETEFEDREATVEFLFDENMYLESVTVSAHFSLGEILEKAGLNTLLGMGTVFVVLIIISLIISLFRYIPAIQDKFSRQPKPADTAAAAPVKAPVKAVRAKEQKPDDSELIAVIAAAIAAAEGTTTDGFVVRSIKRRKSNKWN